MVVPNVLSRVYHAEPEFFDDWVSYSFERLLTNWIAIYMYSQMEYCFKSHLKKILAIA